MSLTNIHSMASLGVTSRTSAFSRAAYSFGSSFASSGAFPNKADLGRNLDLANAAASLDQNRMTLTQLRQLVSLAVRLRGKRRANYFDTWLVKGKAAFRNSRSLLPGTLWRSALSRGIWPMKNWVRFVKTIP